jgi:hypothetical protein
MFGVVPRVFFGRLLKIISSHEAAQEISLEVRTRIVQSCANRLCSNESEAPLTGVRSPANFGFGTVAVPARSGARAKGMCTKHPAAAHSEEWSLLELRLMTDQ